ncbi:MAG: acyl-ACP--UDP-N-acetylglucosamine O-acyltransferase [Desulfohalobiaceae bacterium]|nr:acyl-ACP--UDP-N-acetylglucosamine O-acyltransferase [Desulfohalobiaceae bacterium]
MGKEIHSTAVVSPRAELGENVTIGPFSVIEDKVRIGDGTWLDAFVQIKEHTSIGRRNHIHSYASLGGIPQDLKYKGEISFLELGDDNRIREYASLNRGTEEGGGVTRIGSNCLIMAYAHVAHDCHLEDGVILANAATLAGHVYIEDKATLGGLSAVHQFVRIGRHAYIGGMTGVAQDVPPFMLIAGERGGLQGVNLIGLKRQGFSREQMSNLKKAHKLLWRSGLNKEEALHRIYSEIGNSPEIAQLLDFVQNSERGIVRPK